MIKEQLNTREGMWLRRLLLLGVGVVALVIVFFAFLYSGGRTVPTDDPRGQAIHDCLGPVLKGIMVRHMNVLTEQETEDAPTSAEAVVLLDEQLQLEKVEVFLGRDRAVFGTDYEEAIGAPFVTCLAESGFSPDDLAFNLVVVFDTMQKHHTGVQSETKWFFRFDDF